MKMKIYEHMKNQKIIILENHILDMFDDLGALDYFIRNLWKTSVSSPGRKLFFELFIFGNLKNVPK